MTGLRPTWVEIDLDALRHNVRVGRQLAGPGARFFAVVKSNGYGCDAVPTAKAAVEAGADGVAVGDADEAARLRASGLRAPILLYGSTLPADAAEVAAIGCIPTVHDLPSLEAFGGLGAPLDVYVKLDCGLGRLGFSPAEAPRAFRRLRELQILRVAGVYTHLSAPDDAEATARQAERFAAGCRDAREAGCGEFARMAASTRIMLGYPHLNFEAVNPGRLVFGFLEGRWKAMADVRPVIRAVKTRVVQLKELPSGTEGYGADRLSQGGVRGAVVTIGYGDGLNHRGPVHEVLVRGRRAPVLGPRGIEHSVIDVTAIPDVELGDEVTLLGRQGGDEIGPEELAAAVGVPAIELLTRMARSAPRRYLGETEA